ncbi:uncharacterized protein TNCV_404261 [Trichonephila clavipes]|nr:uncharacterized protein TNCV_404261 [Trichonephila clavipes]
MYRVGSRMNLLVKDFTRFSATDSQVTLHWIKGPIHRWKPFVANRVREIQSLTDPNSWFHCSGKDNPADLLTRGISVDALTTNSKWWNGSSFLRQIDFQTKGLDEAIPERVYLTEMRKNSNPKEDISLTLTVTKNNFLENIIDISNNYVKLIRVEVSHAENWLIHSLHEREFYEEMRKLLAGTLVLIKDENLPSTKWSTGRITEIFPGTDATRGLLATDHVILNYGQVTWTTPELAPPLLTTPPHQREDVSALDRFNVHRCPTRRVFSGTGLELVTKQATFRYLYHSATAAEIY